jgi:hypothetical protein
MPTYPRGAAQIRVEKTEVWEDPQSLAQKNRSIQLNGRETRRKLCQDIFPSGPTLKKKGKDDSQRGRIFTKIGRELAIAVKEAGPIR